MNKNNINEQEQNINEFELADEYFNFFGFSRTEKRILRNISSINYKDVLDVGCGCGRTTAELKKMGFNVVGFDLAKSLVDHGNKTYPDLKLMNMDAMDISKNFRGECFDFVLFSYNGLDYLYPETNRFSVLVQIYKVLKPGGIFVYQSHNKWYRWRAKSRWKKYDGNDNYFQEVSGKRKMKLTTFYDSPMGQKEVLKKIGFVNVKIRGFLPFFHFLNWFFDYAPIYICKK